MDCSDIAVGTAVSATADSSFSRLYCALDPSLSVARCSLPDLDDAAFSILSPSNGVFVVSPPIASESFRSREAAHAIPPLFIVWRPQLMVNVALRRRAIVFIAFPTHVIP